MPSTFVRNLLATVPKFQQEMVPAAFRTMFAYADRAEVCEHYDQVSGTFAEHFAKASALMAGAKEEIRAFSAFPREHWRQIWSTSPLERLNTKLKKRWQVVGIFPNEAAVVRLAGSVPTSTMNGNSGRAPLFLREPA